MKASEWIPLRWSSGPLEMALRKSISAEEKAALEAWHRPEALAILDGSPFNCLAVQFGSGRPEDAEQQRSLQPLIAAAKSKGLAVVGLAGGSREQAADDAARLAGLDALLDLHSPAEAGKATADPVIIKGCEWPSVRTGRSGNAESGPTGYPWVDSNGWVSALARAQAPGKTIWTTAQPKRGAAPVRAEVYALAVADAAAFGSRWVATLDPVAQAGLLSGDSAAREAWSTLTKAVRFFEDRRPEWHSGETLSRLGLACSFEGQTEALGQEVVNLAIRRQLPARILHPSSIEQADLRGLQAVVWMEAKAPTGTVLKTLEGFVSGGPTLVVPPSAAHLAEGRSAAGTHETGYKLYQAGKGRIAVAPAPWTDPYAVTVDAHRLLGRKYDVVRLWNAGSSISNPVIVSDRLLTHVLNYTGRPFGHPMSLYVAKPYGQAKYTDLFGRSEALEVTRKGEGSEVSLPPFTSYAAVEFGGKA